MVAIYEVTWPDDAPTETTSVLGLGVWKRGERRLVPLSEKAAESLRAKGFAVEKTRQKGVKDGISQV